MTGDTPNSLRTPAEAAKRLGISVKTLYAHVHAGRLSYVRTGMGSRRPRMGFTDAALDEFTSPSAAKAWSFTALRSARAAATPDRA